MGQWFSGETKSASRGMDLYGKLKRTMGDTTSEGELRQYVELYSDPQQIETHFFSYDDLYDKLQDDDGNTALLKVKLVIIDLEGWKEKALVSWIAANIGKSAGFLQYGLCHAGMMIGSYVIHWFNDSIVHITATKASTPNCAIDLGTLSIDNDDDKLKLTKLCEIIADYNANRQYHNINCNCHQFTDDCMAALGMPGTFTGQLGHHIKGLRNGNTNKSFRDPTTKKKITFETHSQLDIFCSELFAKHGGIDAFEKEHPQDFALLKAFDRGFWLGHLKDRFSKKHRSEYTQHFCPHSDHDTGDLACAFGDPNETMSMLLT